MKIRNFFILVLVITLSFSFLCCKHDSLEIEAPEENENTEETQNSEESKNTEKTQDSEETKNTEETQGLEEFKNTDETQVSEETEPPKKQIINQFFWGTWQSMANGSLYIINEDSVTGDATSYSVSSSDDSTLVVNTLGTFKKQSESVIVKNSIPYFRKGGANLSYKMKLVGFFDGNDRAASSSSLAGYTVTGKSDAYSSFESSAISDEEGNIELKAPVSGDVQTVTVCNGESTVAVVPGITVENNGSNMGTIPISSEGQYSLKITGTIDESDKDGGYLFYDKEYNIKLTITNISDVGSAPSWCTIEPLNEAISITSGDTEFLISSLQPNLTKTVILSIKASALDALIDTGLNVKVLNLDTDKTWTDFVPIRFHKGLVPITIAAENPEKNLVAALNGFFIYPDGQSKFFQVGHGTSSTVYVPSFNNAEQYKLAFSGAEINGSLSNSTEMAYRVVIDSPETIAVDISTKESAQSAVQYGEKGSKNETEDNAYSVSEDFTAYIGVGDIDFYSFTADSENAVCPNDIPYDWKSYGDSITVPITSSELYYSFYAYRGITYNISQTNSETNISVGSSFDSFDYINNSNADENSFTTSKDGPVFIKIKRNYYYSSQDSNVITVSNDTFLVHLSRVYSNSITYNVSELYDYKIYSFNAVAGRKYNILWDDSTVKVSAGSDSVNPTNYFSSANSGNQTILPTSDGKIYIKILKDKNSYYYSNLSLTVYGDTEISLNLETTGSDFITLDSGYNPEWTEGFISADTDFLIYRFNASYSYQYTVYWADSCQGENGTDTVDVRVTASSSRDFDYNIWENVDNGFTEGKKISNKSGYIYLKIEPYSVGDSGAFRIKVNRI